MEQGSSHRPLFTCSSVSGSHRANRLQQASETVHYWFVSFSPIIAVCCSSSGTSIHSLGQSDLFLGIRGRVATTLAGQASDRLFGPRITEPSSTRRKDLDSVQFCLRQAGTFRLSPRRTVAVIMYLSTHSGCERGEVCSRYGT